MEGLSTIDDFKRLRDRLVANRDPNRPTIVIPAGTCGQASGANDLIRVSKHELLKRNLIDQIDLRITGCHGYCQMEPSILVEPRGTFYPSVGPDEMVRIVDALARGEVVVDLLYEDPATGERIERQQDLPFFANQTRTIISRNEKVDPIRIYNYIQSGGYESFVHVLANGSREWVINEVRLSGLRG